MYKHSDRTRYSAGGVVMRSVTGVTVVAADGRVQVFSGGKGLWEVTACGDVITVYRVRGNKDSEKGLNYQSLGVFIKPVCVFPVCEE